MALGRVSVLASGQELAMVLGWGLVLASVLALGMGSGTVLGMAFGAGGSDDAALLDLYHTACRQAQSWHHEIVPGL